MPDTEDEMISGPTECAICERRCKIPPGKLGFCRTRTNESGMIKSIAYCKITACESRPIEIKPFFHYYPGSTALTFSTFGCNFACPWCQNHHLSRANADDADHEFVEPRKMVARALDGGDDGVCASFQEPTMLFDYCIELFPLARSKGLYRCFVSNGYQTPETLKALIDAGLDGLKIDLKGPQRVYSEALGGLDVSKVWRNAKSARDSGVHVEVVNLVVTGVNDSEDDIRWLAKEHLRNLGDETPLHFTRYHPAYRFHAPATPISTLERAYDIARGGGLKFVYVGNLPGHKHESTFCPECGTLVIKRAGHWMVRNCLDPGARCPKCRTVVPVKARASGPYSA